MLLEALAAAIDGTDTIEIARLAAELNSSFGSIVKNSAGTQPEISQGDINLLRSIGPVSSTSQPSGSGPQTSKERLLTRGELRSDHPPRAEMTVIPKSKNKRPQTHVEVLSSDEPQDPDEHKQKKTMRDHSSASEESESKKSKRRAARRKLLKKKKKSASEESSSETSSSSSEDNTSDDSVDEDNAEMCYDITNFDSADLPDLPDKWDKGFRKLCSYVPLSLFKPSLLESYHDDDKIQSAKDKSDLSKSSLKAIEKQITYGDFIEMCDLEERYTQEIYGLETYADYIVQHKKIVSDLKKTYNCWMIGLRYHLKVQTVIFRRRKLIRTKVKGKTTVKDKVKIPDGLQPSVERQARHNADRAGDLQFVDNPYAVGGPKFGFNFTTGRQIAQSTALIVKEKASVSAQAAQPVYRGSRAGGVRRPQVRRQPYTFNRFQRQTADSYQGKNMFCHPQLTHDSRSLTIKKLLL